MIFRKLFKKEINPYDVTEKLVFRNLDKTLTLTVKARAGMLVKGIKKAYERIAVLKDESPEEEKAAAARLYAVSIFCEEQGEKLCEFYGDPLTVIQACNACLDELRPKVIKTQKRTKVIKTQKK